MPSLGSSRLHLVIPFKYMVLQHLYFSIFILFEEYRTTITLWRFFNYFCRPGKSFQNTSISTVYEIIGWVPSVWILSFFLSFFFIKPEIFILFSPGRSCCELQQADAEHDEPVDPELGRGRHSLHRLLRSLLSCRLRASTQLALWRRVVSQSFSYY